MDPLVLDPIGHVQTGKDLKFQTPHQPNTESDETNLIVLKKGHQFDIALQDLEGFEYIWLIWWFHRNNTWRPRVIPPRGPKKRRGVFATRSPHRPNPIGLTSVKLLKVEGNVLTVGALDLVDGTPILDIKPYVPGIDAHPNAEAGWVSELNRMLANGPDYVVEWEPQAEGILPEELTDRATELLAIDPSPHRTRRIMQMKDGTRRLGCGPWRVYFTVEERNVRIHLVTLGNADRIE